MTQQIFISDTLYQLLSKRAAQESTSPEQVAETLLAQEFALSGELDPTSETDVNEALAAVHRLTTLFADVQLPNLEQALNDPIPH